MSTLTGKALQDRAKELNIPGRSTLKAGELRLAIAAAEEAEQLFARAEEAEAELELLTDETPWFPVQRNVAMSTERRADVYRDHNNGGAPRPGRQSRRLKKKANRLALAQAKAA